MELDTFIGEWRDSMGHQVTVDWASPGNRAGQLEVLLSKSGRDPIRLNVKRHGNGRFTCGHYDLNQDESTEMRITWQDAKNRRKYSTWDREGEPPSRTGRRRSGYGYDTWQGRDFHGDTRSESRHDSWGNQGSQYDDWKRRDAGWSNSDRDRGRQEWDRDSCDNRRSQDRSRDDRGRDDRSRNDRGHDDRGHSDRGHNDCSRERDTDKTDDGHGDRRRSRASERGNMTTMAAPEGGGRVPADTSAVNAPDFRVAPAPPPMMTPPPVWGPWGSHGMWGGYPLQGHAHPPPLFQPLPPQHPHASFMSGAPTPGAWVPPAGGPPPLTPYPAPAPPDLAPDADPGQPPPGQPGDYPAPPARDWRPVIEEMYRRHNPAKLPELDGIFAKYQGKEEELYRALCEKYAAPALPPPQRQPSHQPPPLQASPPGDWHNLAPAVPPVPPPEYKAVWQNPAASPDAAGPLHAAIPEANKPLEPDPKRPRTTAPAGVEDPHLSGGP